MMGQLGRLGRLGKLGAVGRAIAPLQSQLWPLGAASPGMWIQPRYLAGDFQDSAGTTALSAIGTVLDTSNPIGLILDRKAGATSPADPGVHLSQSTSASRPVASARVNWLYPTEDWTHANWITAEMALTGTTVCTVTPTIVNSQHRFTNNSGTVAGPCVISIEVKPNGFSKFAIKETISTGYYAAFDLSSGGSVIQATGPANSIELLSDGYYRISLSIDAAVSVGRTFIILAPGYVGGDPNGSTFVGDGVSGVLVRKPQLNLGSTALPCQYVNTDSDYDASVAPVATKFDGVDDALASATFTANTVLTSGMTALIAVRRDSTANMMCGLLDASGAWYFGAAASGNAGNSCIGVGTPTTWVDGGQLTGGTNVTSDTLHTALTPGGFHILEFRGLDLSAKTALTFSGLGGWKVNGALGEIMLFANPSEADLNKARAQMAAYFGVTLP